MVKEITQSRSYKTGDLEAKAWAMRVTRLEVFKLFLATATQDWEYKITYTEKHSVAVTHNRMIYSLTLKLDEEPTL